MRHKVSGRKLGRSSAHRRALYRNLVSDLLGYESINTTEAKAKEIRRLAEKMVTLGKKGSLSHRRRALAYIFDGKVVEKVFDEMAKRYAERAGGYTRITKLGARLGDGAAMVKIEMLPVSTAE
jgi:large subunit ribosomal protein L17